MENETTTNATKLGSDGVKPTPATTTTASSDHEQNPTSNPSPPSVADPQNDPTGSDSTSLQTPSRHSSRTPFTNLTQVDADLALARTLQEQERAYLMLRMTSEGSDFGSWEAGSYVLDDEDGFGDPHDHTESDGDDDEFDGTDVNDDDDVFDVHAHEDGEDNNPNFELDPGNFSSDEAYARALQDAEDREMAARLLALAGLQDQDADDTDDQGENSQDTWEDVDPDELSYEELLALGEVVGTESRGLSADTIASLPSINFKAGSGQTGSSDSCVICRLDFEDDETLTVLSCKHSYHSECINNWLKINKVCPVCSTEVSTATGSS
ncbi:E3 ubiquitin ligase BIG BROTHER-related [Cucurbita pepo subsp. pepo]|uniref:E3 ubiquitin ligase BIG BROTHER-related n=1 Tax=Cucurbita pepo subsp. pepo TaxID=3664 RepID=UPI000C9D344B|nr:E3 ubiquitin ligase BIG BROTHER-related [Cucurbita pepo subsp. pepo]